MQRHKRDKWPGLWDEERKNDPALQKQRADTDPERDKKESMWQALDEAAKRDD